jgi:hypothetical protein
MPITPTKNAAAKGASIHFTGCIPWMPLLTNPGRMTRDPATDCIERARC